MVIAFLPMANPIDILIINRPSSNRRHSSAARRHRSMQCRSPPGPSRASAGLPWPVRLVVADARGQLIWRHARDLVVRTIEAAGERTRAQLLDIFPIELIIMSERPDHPPARQRPPVSGKLDAAMLGPGHIESE